MKEKNSVQQRKVAMTGRRKGQAGQSLVLVALSLAALLGMVGMGIDMGFLRYQKGRMQAAADAAALAGGAELQYADLTTAIQNAASVNGYTDGSNGVTVTINHPPTSGVHSSPPDPSYVEVIVSQNQPTFFMNILGVHSMPMTARAVGTGVGNYCVYGLATTGTSLLVQDASITLKCPAVGDSNLVGSGSPATLAAPNVAIVGSNTGATVNPAANLNTGISAVADPFASQLTAPTVDTTCAAHPSKTTITTTQTLSPGTYCGGILISTSGLTVTMSTGTYVMYGGGFQTSTGVTTNIQAPNNSGVTIYNTGAGTGSCNTCYGAVNLDFTSSTVLTAPTATGSLEGILFYQDPNNTQQATLNGATGAYLQGVYYFPTATLEIESDFGSSTQGFSTIVANEVWWNGAGGSGGHGTWNDDDDFSRDHDGDPDHRRRGRLGGS